MQTAIRSSLHSLSTLGLLLLASVPTFSQKGNIAYAENVQAAGGVSLDRVDHSTWNRLLKKHVDADGMVDYQAWKNSPADQAALRDYLATLSSTNPNELTPRAEKLAFWINAYNALTIQGILDVYPTTSIRNHTARLFGYNIWDDLPLPFGGKKYSLNNIEHEILRKQGEPRIHFAIVCASIGCPRLRNEAYTAAKLETQLADNTRDFFSRRRNLQVDVQRRIVHVSSILDWFSEDFGITPEKGLAGLAESMPEDAARLVEQSGFSVKYLKYDWQLNSQ